MPEYQQNTVYVVYLAVILIWRFGTSESPNLNRAVLILNQSLYRHAVAYLYVGIVLARLYCCCRIKSMLWVGVALLQNSS